MKTCLYRHFDSKEKLLYVGISLHSISRLQQHSKQASWVADISRVEMQWFPSREEALQAEKNAIQMEFPLHNKQHSVGHPQPEDELFLSPQEAADRVGVSRKTIMDAISALTLHATQNDNHRWRVKSSDLHRWSSQRKPRYASGTDPSSKEFLRSKLKKTEEAYEEALRRQKLMLQEWNGYMSERLAIAEVEKSRLKLEIAEAEARKSRLKEEIVTARMETAEAVSHFLEQRTVPTASPREKRSHLVTRLLDFFTTRSVSGQI